MRIGLYIANFYGGGAERTIVNLANEFYQMGHVVHLIVCSASGVRKSEISSSIEISILNCSRERYSFLKLAKTINDLQLDVCMSTMIGSNLALGLAKPFIKNTKIVFRESNYRGHQLARKSFKTWAQSMLYKVADHVIGNSQGVSDFIIKNYKIENVTTVYNPINLKTIIELSIEENAFTVKASDLRLNGKFLIVAVGRLHFQKGFDLLLKSLSLLKDREFHLFIIGEGEERSNLESIIDEYNLNKVVTLTGFLKNPYSLMKRSDLFILSSRWEGFGHVLAESLAVGTIPIAFNCKSGPSEILTGNLSKLLLEPENVESLTNLIELHKNEAIDISKELLINRSVDFDSNAIARSYLNVFQDLYNNK